MHWIAQHRHRFFTRGKSITVSGQNPHALAYVGNLTTIEGNSEHGTELSPVIVDVT